MVTGESIVTALDDQDFEHLFIEELGWDRFQGRLIVSLPVPGQFTQGWLTREERWQRAVSRHIDYHLHGVALLGGQVVFTVVFPEERSIPDYLGRCAIGRRVSRLHYQPVVIYSCPNDREQVWQFVASAGGEPDFFEHRLDSIQDVFSFARKLDVLRFELAERATGVSSLEVGNRLRRSLAYLKQKRVFDRTRQTAATFAEFGNGLPELADSADEHRGLERDEEATLVELALAGSDWARQRLFESHLYIPLKIALRTYRRKELAGRVELADIVSHGIVGLLNAIRLFTPGKTPRFMTFASLWVQREIDREVLEDARPIAIPFYVEGSLGQIANRLDIEEDKLAQILMRLPTEWEVQERLGLSDRDWRTLMLMTLPLDRIEIEDEHCDAFAEEWGLSHNPLNPDVVASREQEILDTLMERLRPRQRDVLVLRYGVHPCRYGREHTLDEVGAHLEVTRERVRQIELGTKKQLTAMVAAMSTTTRARPDVELNA